MSSHHLHQLVTRRDLLIHVVRSCFHLSWSLNHLLFEVSLRLTVKLPARIFAGKSMRSWSANIKMLSSQLTLSRLTSTVKRKVMKRHWIKRNKHLIECFGFIISEHNEGLHKSFRNGLPSFLPSFFWKNFDVNRNGVAREIEGIGKRNKRHFVAETILSRKNRFTETRKRSEALPSSEKNSVSQLGKKLGKNSEGRFGRIYEAPQCSQ